MTNSTASSASSESTAKNLKKNNVTKEKSPLRQKDIRTGAQQERERIIALLDSLKCNCDGECGMVEAPFTVLERLINGEN
jgi:hypothetical protein